MAARDTKLRKSDDSALKIADALSERTADNPSQQPADNLSQRKRPETGRFLLQVDRQTKGSYATVETAAAAGLAIKTAHPVVQVSFYDSLECQNTVVELPA